MFGFSRAPLELSVILASLLLLMMRLWQVGKIPAGFHSDETMMFANSMCLRHTGHDMWGESWGFFSGGPVNSYGFFIAAPFHLSLTYGAWLYLAGDTIAAARSFSVLISLVVVACIVAVAYNLLGRRGAVWTLALSAVSPWTWTISRVAWVHTEFITMHLFIALVVLTRHFRRDRPPSNTELFWGGLFIGVALSQFYSTLSAAIIAVLAMVYVYRPTRNRAKPAILIAGLVTSLVPFQMGFGQYAGNRALQMASFQELETKKGIIDKTWTLARITLEHFWQHVGPDFMIFEGDPNLRHHSGWGGELSWPQILLLALLPIAAYVIYKNFTVNRRYAIPIVLSMGGALGGLLTSSATGEQVNANRALVSAHFLVLGCAVIGLVVSPVLKKLPVVCVVLGLVFSALFLHDYFTGYGDRSRGWFQYEVRVAGEQAQLTGDFEGFYRQIPDFTRKYGLLSERGLLFYEAAGSGRGCPGYGR
ncbi:MAG: hypothetical protein B7C54_12770 [Acidimicrobiales bacterium mtb01]|nr:MAG: hypothetical protein B7C54_12770 [Acidimicrobiales bacterium mtb01]